MPIYLPAVVRIRLRAAVEKARAPRNKVLNVVDHSDGPAGTPAALLFGFMRSMVDSRDFTADLHKTGAVMGLASALLFRTFCGESRPRFEWQSTGKLNVGLKTRTSAILDWAPPGSAQWTLDKFLSFNMFWTQQ